MKYDEFGMHKNTRKILLEDIKIEDKSKINIENFNALCAIDVFTMIEDNNFKLLLQKYYNIDKITFNKENGIYQYTYDDGRIIEFKLISQNINQNLNLVKKELTSPKRKRKCHDGSIVLSLMFKGSKITTGYIYFYDEKIIHSVCEIQYNGKEYVLDYTRNIIMMKNQYYEVFNFEPITNLNIEDFIKDCKLIKTTGLALKTYLVFREQIIRELEEKRNQKVKKLG